MTRALSPLLLAGLLLSAIVLAARTMYGPFHIGWLSVQSPVNAQCIFAGTLTLLLALRAVPATACDRIARGWHLLSALVVLAACAALAPSLSFHVLSDDFSLLLDANTYIEEFPVQVANVFFRPVGFLLVTLVWHWAAWEISLWHLAGLALHAATAALVFAFVWRLRFGMWAAFVAATVFALHGSRPEAVVWLAGWFDMFATIFLLAGLLFFEQHRELGSFWRLSASLLCMVLAMLSKETGFVFPLLVTLLAWHGRRLRREDLPRLATFFALGAIVFAWRWHRLGGVGGYADSTTGVAEIFSMGILGSLKALLMRIWGAFYFPVNWSVEPGPALGLVLVGGAACYAMLLGSRPARRSVLFALAFTLLSALPARSQLLVGADMEKSRGLYLPSVGFCILLGLAVEHLPSRRRRWIVGCSLVLLHWTVLQHNLRIWERVSSLAIESCFSAASSIQPSTRRVVASGLPGIIDGVYFFRNGFPACLELHTGRRIEQVEVIPRGKLPEPDDSTLVLTWNPDSENLLPVARQPSYDERKPDVQGSSCQRSSQGRSSRFGQALRE